MSTNAESTAAVTGNSLGLKLSPEDQLLVVCARPELSDLYVERAVAIASGQLDWEQVVEGARWHKLEGLLYRHVTRTKLGDLVPEPVRAELHGMYRHTTAKQIFFRSELSSILTAFDLAGIQTVLLKGAALVHEIYDGDLGVRPMADLDLLVRAEQAHEARDVLKGMSFRSGVDAETEHQMEQVDRQFAAMGRPGSPVVVEVHTHLVGADNPIRFDIDTIWQGVRSTGINGRNVLVLKPEALLASLAVNFLKDRRFYSYSALGQLCDVAEVVRTYAGQIDWTMFEQGGLYVEIRSILFGALHPAKYLLDAPVPDQVLENLKPPGYRARVASNLVRDRIIGKNWVAKDLGGEHRAYSSWELPKLMLRRVFVSRRQFEYLQGASEKTTRAAYLMANLRRLMNAATLAVKSLIRPRGLYEDLSVDRWLNSLYRPRD
ncbi:MAG: nucleotidyltransferase family protein [Chloroflexi bacterium]|nr:nucleotidyltransferase family protein [Chloroflexota bacterium]